MQLRQNIWVDGSLRNADFYSMQFESLRKRSAADTGGVAKPDHSTPFPLQSFRTRSAITAAHGLCSESRQVPTIGHRYVVSCNTYSGNYVGRMRRLGSAPPSARGGTWPTSLHSSLAP